MLEFVRGLPPYRLIEGIHDARMILGRYQVEKILMGRRDLTRQQTEKPRRFVRPCEPPRREVQLPSAHPRNPMRLRKHPHRPGPECYVSDDGHDAEPVFAVRGQRREADLNRKLGPVLPSRKEVEEGTHLAEPRLFHVTLSMHRMHRPQGLGEQ